MSSTDRPLPAKQPRPSLANAIVLLQTAATDDRIAAEQLSPPVYEQLRALVGSQFSAQPGVNKGTPERVDLRIVEASTPAVASSTPGSA